MPEDDRQGWLEGLEALQIDEAYKIAFDRWESGLKTLAATRVEVTSVSRLLVGHGNPSGSDVGMTVQHTWGAPIIPASSLKGLLQHHLVAKYGPDPAHWESHPLDENHPELERALFQPAFWSKRSIVHTPGHAIRMLFGALDADTDNQVPWSGSDHVGAAKGSLQFLDAWWKPDQNRQPFAADILNVHQRTYYGQNGPQSWPNDYGSPVPVQFITVRPSQTFLLAVAGEENLARWALEQLVEALAVRGVGGKTSAGYGALEMQGRTTRRDVEVESAPILDDLKAYLAKEKTPPGLTEESGQRELLNYISESMLDSLRALNPDQRRDAAEALKKSKLAKNRRLKEDVKKLAKK